MKMFTYEKLQRSVSSGRMKRHDIQRCLEICRKSAQPSLTMRTLGAFSHDLSNAEREAREEIEKMRLEAASDVEVLERVLREMDAPATVAPRCVRCGGPGEMTSPLGIVCPDCYDVAEGN